MDIWDHSRSEPISTYSWGADSVLSVRFNPVRLGADCQAFPPAVNPMAAWQLQLGKLSLPIQHVSAHVGLVHVPYSIARNLLRSFKEPRHSFTHMGSCALGVWVHLTVNARQKL